MGKGNGNGSLHQKQTANDQTPRDNAHAATDRQAVDAQAPDLHVFGAVAYPLNKQHKRAMEPRAEVGIFMGYAPEGFVIWIPKRRRFLRTDAVLVDDATYTIQGGQKSKFQTVSPQPVEPIDN